MNEPSYSKVLPASVLSFQAGGVLYLYADPETSLLVVALICTRWGMTMRVPATQTRGLEILFELLHTRPQSKFIGNKKWTIDMYPIPAGVCPCGAATRAEAYAEGQQTMR